MKLTEHDLRRLYQESTSSADCPAEDLLLRAARGELNRREREEVAAHIAGCSACARFYQVAYAMRPLADEADASGRARRPWLPLAAAAALLLMIPILIWSALRIQHDAATIASLRERVRAASRTPPPPVKREEKPATTTIAELTPPQIDTPIVDLDPDPTRSTNDRGATPITLTPTSNVFTLILHLDDPIRGNVHVSIEDSLKNEVWKGSWNAPAGTTSITLTLHRERFPAGTYRVKVKEQWYRFRVEGGGQ